MKYRLLFTAAMFCALAFLPGVCSIARPATSDEPEKQAPENVKPQNDPVRPSSPEAQKMLDVGVDLYKDAVLTGTPQAWEAAIDALTRAYDLEPNYAPVTVQLASACQQRGLFLTAIAWAYASLYAAPTDKDTTDARSIIEFCSRKAEAQRIAIFAAARKLAGSVHAAPAMYTPEGVAMFTMYSWQRMKLDSGYPLPLHYFANTLDYQQGLLLDIQYVQAQAGDFEAFTEEAKARLANRNKDEPGMGSLPARCASPFWKAYFDTCVETEDWAGAMAALDWDYDSLKVPGSLQEELRWWSWQQDHTFNALSDTWKQLLEKYYDSRGEENPLGTRQKIVEAWARLATQIGRDERGLHIEESVQDLQKQAENKQGEPETIPVRVADLAVPVGKAMRSIHGLGVASDNELLARIWDKVPGVYAPDSGWRGLEEVKPLFEANPRLFRMRGLRDVTLLHVAVLGSHTLFPVFRELYNTDRKSFGVGAGVPGRGIVNRDEGLSQLRSAKAYVEFLLDHKADVNARMTNGWTPLHMAAVGMSGDDQAVEFTKLLLAKGADVQATTKYGMTALHVAAWSGNPGVVECLLARGASAEATTDDGRTPLHVATGTAAEYARICDLLLAKGGDVEAQDRYGRTPLHFAAINACQPAVAYLLKKGAAINATTSLTNETPLHWAAARGYREVTKLLVGAGADVSAREINGKTAAELARENDHAELAEYLEGQEKP